MEPAAELSSEIKAFLLRLARTTLERIIAGEALPSAEYRFPILSEKRGAFVTLHKKGQLRGCIGYVRPYKPLEQTIIEMTESAALHDPRFLAVEADEIKDLEIEISVLSPLQLIDDSEAITVGFHGIYLESEFRSGLLLPQVATEYGWDRETFLEHTCLKAGLGRNAWKSKTTQIYVFSANIFSERDFQSA